MRLVWAGLALFAVLAAACDKVPLLAPSLSTIALSTNTSILQANGTAEIRATVLESSGTPVQNGTTVTFTTTLGTLSPTEAQTVNGVAVVQFMANGQSGIAEIRAISGGTTPADTTNPSLKITMGAAAASRVVVNAAPSRISNSGGSTQITAVVSDANGNALPSVPVAFSTTAGTLSSSVATTGSNGQATTTLTTSRDATVTATAGSSATGTAAPSGTVNVTVGSLPDLTIAPATTTGTTISQGQPVVFTLTVGATATSDPFQSIVVDFGDGQVSPPLGGGSTSISHVYSSARTYTVNATGRTASGDTKVASTVITVAPRTPIAITLTISPTSPTALTTTTLTAAFEGTAPANISGYSWSFGDGTTDFTNGRTTFHVYGSPGTFNASVTVKTTDGNEGTASAQFRVN